MHFVYLQRYIFDIYCLEGGVKMGVSKAHQAAVNRYMARHYDRITMTVPKGEKEKIKAHAEANGESVNGYLYRLVREDMEKNC